MLTRSTFWPSRHPQTPSKPTSPHKMVLAWFKDAASIPTSAFRSLEAVKGFSQRCFCVGCPLKHPQGCRHVGVWCHCDVPPCRAEEGPQVMGVTGELLCCGQRPVKPRASLSAALVLTEPEKITTRFYLLPGYYTE